MFEKYFNKSFEMIEFPHFVPKEELEYNLEYARRIKEEKWIPSIWKIKAEESNPLEKEFWQKIAKRIVSHSGLILEICAGPAGGTMPAVLSEDYNAKIMISDLCPTVVSEWKKFFDGIEEPPKNVEYAAFNSCDIPFKNECLDIVTGYDAVINVEGDRVKALSEIYRVLKPGGLFVMNDCALDKDFINSMDMDIKKTLTECSPNIFNDYHDELEKLGFSVETVSGHKWSNKNDESTLAEFTRSLGLEELIFNNFTKFCTK